MNRVNIPFDIGMVLMIVMNVTWMVWRMNLVGWIQSSRRISGPVKIQRHQMLRMQAERGKAVRWRSL